MGALTEEPTADDCPDTCVPTNADRELFRTAFRAMVGKWKLEIVFALADGSRRFGELRRAMPGVTQHMLTGQLRELEADGLVRRTAFDETPPRVEYELTDATRALEPVFEALYAWAHIHGSQLGAGRSA